MDKRYSQTEYLVEATSFEKTALWKDYSTTHDWRDHLDGYLPVCGSLNDRPICISALWADIEGRLVMFWHPTSNLVDYEVIEFWLKNNCTKAKHNDANNFHAVLNDIYLANQREVEL